MEQQKIESPMPAQFFFSLVKITGYVIMALELYPVPPKPSPPPLHTTRVSWWTSHWSSLLFVMKRFNVDRLFLGTFFFLFLIVTFHLFSHTFYSGEKKSPTRNFCTKHIWIFHLWPHSKLNIYLCLSYYLSPALTIVVDNLTLRR